MQTLLKYADLNYVGALGAHEVTISIDLQNFGDKWHQECYKHITHQTNIDRLIEQYKKLQTKTI